MHWLKAIFILIMIGVNWASLILLFLPLHIIATTSGFFLSIRWSYSLFIAEDHLVNVIMGGHFLTTVSAEIGNMQTNGSRTGKNVAKVVNWLFYKFTGDPKQKDHCRISIEPNDIFVFSPRRSILGTLLFQGVVVAIINAILQTYIL